MPAPFIVPFNFQPSSTTIKTTSYTIPAGKYALVRALSPFFSIDGVQLYPSGNLSFGSGSAVVSNYIALISPSYVFSASITVSGTASASWGYGNNGSYLTVVSSRSTSGAFSNAFVPSGTLWAQASGSGIGSCTVSISYYYFQGVTEFWVNAGQVINGNSFVVSEYNVII